jgi:NTE family protein
MDTALVLAGAVAKGAFEAGVLSVLAESSERVGNIVATSAGALNAAVYATGVRFGRERRAVEVLCGLWEEEAEWGRIVDFSLRGVIGGRGLASTDALLDIVEHGMQAVAEGAQPVNDVVLRLVTTALRGLVLDPKGIPTTTFEHLLKVESDAFDSVEGRHRVAAAATASAAFPGLFVPVEVEGVGPCIDGGAVNNAPISWAIEEGMERVIVVTGNPLALPPEDDLAWLDLIGKEVDIAINERLFRDLLQARKINEKLSWLDEALAARGLDESARAAIREGLGWKPLEIIEVRPAEPLAGNAFSALSDGKLRREYLAQGKQAARAALSRRTGA